MPFEALHDFKSKRRKLLQKIQLKSWVVPPPNYSLLNSSNPLFLHKAGRKNEFCTVLRGRCQFSVFVYQPSHPLPKTMPLLGELQSSLIKKCFRVSIYDSLSSIVSQFLSLMTASAFHNRYIDKNQHVLVSFSKPLKIHINRTITSNSSAIFFLPL